MGLMGRRALPAGHALWLPGDNGIHMFFMRFPIDALFLAKPAADGSRAVVAARRNLRPWVGMVPFVAAHRACWSCRPARSTRRRPPSATSSASPELASWAVASTTALRRMTAPVEIGTRRFPPIGLVILAAVGAFLLVVVATTSWPGATDEQAYWRAAVRFAAGGSMYDPSAVPGTPRTATGTRRRWCRCLRR
jgi:hypothetical protein